jgi:hypothetical protein
MDITRLQKDVFALEQAHFDAMALDIFRFQAESCKVYRQYLNHLQIDITKIVNTADIPYLPIEFFKNFQVQTGDFDPDIVFESSSTTGQGVSRHFVRDKDQYTKSFTGSFEVFMEDHRAYCHLALLPSYLERQHSSLVFQVDHFIRESRYPQSSFFLHDMERLQQVLLDNEHQHIPTVLWGVTYALLDFAEQFPMPLRHTSMIETGGMKGRRKEITREEMHGILLRQFDLEAIGGEYGMTELMSQAYARKAGVYVCPPWMRVTAREVNDPLGKPIFERHGALNIIDLANLDSCCFIATSDLGRVQPDYSFAVLGRIDHSDTRGCNLLV